MKTAFAICLAATIAAVTAAVTAMEQTQPPSAATPDLAPKVEIEPAALALVKAMSDYDAVASAAETSGSARESYLAARMQSGTISKAERVELGGILSNAGDVLSKSGRPGARAEPRVIEPGSDADGLVDMSPFLNDLVKGINSHLSDLGEEVARESGMNRELIKSTGTLLHKVAGVVVAQNEMIKALQERVDTVERTPANPRAVERHDPRSVRTRQPGAHGRDGKDGALTKSEISKGLDRLIKAARDSNDEAAQRRLTHEIAKDESVGMLHPTTVAAIREIQG